jgi:hypothetical protein
MNEIYVSLFSTAVTKSLRQSTSKQERFILAHNIRGFSLWVVGHDDLGPLVRQHIMAGAPGGRNRERRGLESQNPLQGHTLSDLTSSTRSQSTKRKGSTSF